MRGWIDWIAKGLWAARKPILIVVGVSTLITGIGILRSVDLSPRPSRTMHDPTFERAATALCTKKLPPLRAVRREGQPEGNREQQTARAVDRVATKLEAVVVELRALPRRDADAAQIESWLTHFDDYIAAGRHYATAVRGGNETVYNKVDNEAVAPLKAISSFARANRIDACIP